jgi:hypothetical protein
MPHCGRDLGAVVRATVMLSLFGMKATDPGVAALQKALPKPHIKR